MMSPHTFDDVTLHTLHTGYGTPVSFRFLNPEYDTAQETNGVAPGVELQSQSNSFYPLDVDETYATINDIPVHTNQLEINPGKKLLMEMTWSWSLMVMVNNTFRAPVTHFQEEKFFQAICWKSPQTSSMKNL